MLSEKQEKLFDHLLTSLGFEEGEHRNKYKLFFSSFISNKAIPKLFTYQNYNTGKYNTIDVGYNVIDALFEELDLRKNQNWSFKKTFKTQNTILTASDLSAYTFCPVNYAIINTFNIEATSNMEEGTTLHEKLKLIGLRNTIQEDYNFTEIKPIYQDDNNAHFFKEIRESISIHSGHTQNGDNFLNKEANFCGNPDYVFEHPQNGRFIVEEKFRNGFDGTSAFANHKVQLASYIYKLDMFNANHGYLLYWYYSKYYDDLTIEKCRVYRINRSATVESFVDLTLKKVADFNKERKEIFEPSSLNPKKCASCSVNKFCGHKSGIYKDLEYPYSVKYLKKFYSKYESE